MLLLQFLVVFSCRLVLDSNKSQVMALLSIHGPSPIFFAALVVYLKIGVVLSPFAGGCEATVFIYASIDDSAMGNHPSADGDVASDFGSPRSRAPAHGLRDISSRSAVIAGSDLFRSIGVSVGRVFVTITIGHVFVKLAADQVLVKLATGHVFVKLAADQVLVKLATGHVFVRLAAGHVFFELAAGHIFANLAAGQVVQVVPLVVHDARCPAPQRLARVSQTYAPWANLATKHRFSDALLNTLWGQLAVESNERIAISVYAPLKLDIGGFLDWWIVTTVSINLEQHVFSSKSLVPQSFWSSWVVLMVGVLRASWSLMLGNGDISSLLHYQRKFAAQQLCMLFGNQPKVTLISFLNCILNLRSSHGHVNAFVRVDHRRPSKPLSSSPRFNKATHDHVCLSLVKHTKNQRLNAPKPQVPSLIMQLKGPSAGQSGVHR
ncbi:hypothetical protein ACP70R_009309 [Stipagrostis hirtigluma subsp. patula]